MQKQSNPFDLAEWIGRKPESVRGTEIVGYIIECALRWMGDDAGNICNPPPPTWQPVIPVMLASFEMREALKAAAAVLGYADAHMPDCPHKRAWAKATTAIAKAKGGVA